MMAKKMGHTNPEGYDSRHKSILDRYCDSLWRPFVSGKAAVFSRGADCVDLGCGTGEYTKSMQHARSITCVDSSPAMLESAKKKLSGMPGVKLKFLKADAAKLPLGESSADFVLCVGLLEYVDAGKILCECGRFLRPGGKMMAVAPNRFNPYIFFIAAKNRVRGEQANLNRSVGEIVSLGKKAGFRLVEADSFAVVSWCPPGIQQLALPFWKLADFVLKPLRKWLPLGKSVYVLLEKA
jgi:ubiquinone/menaquinone biosynthesis C-methylase UbiE